MFHFLLLDVWGWIGKICSKVFIQNEDRLEWNLFDDTARSRPGTFLVVGTFDRWQKGTVFVRREIWSGIFPGDMARTRSLGGFCALICLVTFIPKQMLFLTWCGSIPPVPHCPTVNLTIKTKTQRHCSGWGNVGSFFCVWAGFAISFPNGLRFTTLTQP